MKYIYSLTSISSVIVVFSVLRKAVLGRISFRIKKPAITFHLYYSGYLPVLQEEMVNIPTYALMQMQKAFSCLFPLNQDRSANLAMRFALLLFCQGAFLQARRHFAKEYFLKIAKVAENFGFSNKTEYRNQDFHFVKRIYYSNIPMVCYMTKKYFENIVE